MKCALVLLGIVLALFLLGAAAQAHGCVPLASLRARARALDTRHTLTCPSYSHAHDDDDDDHHGHDHAHGHSHGGHEHSHSHSHGAAAPVASSGKYDPPKPATPSVFFEPFDDAWASRWVRLSSLSCTHFPLATHPPV